MSFTAGGLHYQESVLLAELYLKVKDWSIVKEKVFKENILQAQTLSTITRKYGEIYGKLKLLNDKELTIIRDGTRQEQNYVLWLAVCRRYKFIAEFAKEVLREKHLKMDTALSTEDYETFFGQKSEWHEELEQLSQKTKNKLRQVIFRTLREAEIIDKKNVISSCIFTPKLANVLKKSSPDGFELFPVTEDYSRNN